MLNECMFPAVSRDRGGARTTAHCGRGLPRISGFLMTEPICLSACCPAFCTLTWESVSTSVSLGTMLGRQDDSCLGAQYAIAPSSSTDPVDGTHTSSTESLGTGQQSPGLAAQKGQPACSSADSRQRTEGTSCSKDQDRGDWLSPGYAPRPIYSTEFLWPVSSSTNEETDLDL